MGSIKLGNGLTIFLIFFGVSIVEAFRTTDWKWITFWILAGIGFFRVDRMRRKRK